MTIYDFTVTAMNGQDEPLSNYQDAVVVIVNTASKCGFTPQLEGLEKLYETYKEQNFVVLGFPCNQFLLQDPKSNEEIMEFCQMNYGVHFPMHQKIKVNGKNADPLYQYLVKETGNKRIEWNFTKFLIGRNGEILQRYGSKVTPEEMTQDIEAALAK